MRGALSRYQRNPTSKEIKVKEPTKHTKQRPCVKSKDPPRFPLEKMMRRLSRFWDHRDERSCYRDLAVETKTEIAAEVSLPRLRLLSRSFCRDWDWNCCQGLTVETKIVVDFTAETQISAKVSLPRLRSLRRGSVEGCRGLNRGMWVFR